MHSLAHSSSRELLECPGLSSVLGRAVDAVPDGGAAAGAEAACRGEGCGVERAVASGGFLATGVTRCCCDADCLGPFSLSFSFSLASFVLDEEPPMDDTSRLVVSKLVVGKNLAGVEGISSPFVVCVEVRREAAFVARLQR